MPSKIVQDFMEALAETEASHDPTPLVNLFTEEAEMDRMTGQEHLSGRGAALRFWSEYLSAFRDIQSDVYHVVEQDNQIVMEWTSRAETARGKSFEYCGVSILETADDQVCKFRTYYDSAKVLSANAAGSKSSTSQRSSARDAGVKRGYGG